MMSKEAIKHYEAALKEAFPRGATGEVFHHWNEARYLIATEALDRMAENARELGLDYTMTQTGVGIGERAEKAYEAAKERGWVGVSDERLMEMPEQVPVTDNTYGYAKSLAEAIFKQHFASDENYASGRVVWGVNDTVIGILTQIDNMVADMVRRSEQSAQQEPLTEKRIIELYSFWVVDCQDVVGFARAIERSKPQMQPCAGRNCGSTNPNLHSAECFEDYEKATGMAQQEPVLWRWKDTDMVSPYSKTGTEGWQPLYTRPQEREPLTDERVQEVVREAHIAFCLNKFPTFEEAIIRKTEAAHGIGEKK